MTCHETKKTNPFEPATFLYWIVVFHMMSAFFMFQISKTDLEKQKVLQSNPFFEQKTPWYLNWYSKGYFFLSLVVMGFLTPLFWRPHSVHAQPFLNPYPAPTAELVENPLLKYSPSRPYYLSVQNNTKLSGQISPSQNSVVFGLGFSTPGNQQVGTRSTQSNRVSLSDNDIQTIKDFLKALPELHQSQQNLKKIADSLQLGKEDYYKLVLTTLKEQNSSIRQTINTLDVDLKENTSDSVLLFKDTQGREHPVSKDGLKSLFIGKKHEAEKVFSRFEKIKKTDKAINEEFHAHEALSTVHQNFNNWVVAKEAAIQEPVPYKKKSLPSPVFTFYTTIPRFEPFSLSAVCPLDNFDLEVGLGAVKTFKTFGDAFGPFVGVSAGVSVKSLRHGQVKFVGRGMCGVAIFH